MLELSYRLSVALAIGLIIGLERGWTSRNEAEGERSIGLRTLGLAGLLGGVTGALCLKTGEGGTLFGLVFLAFAAAVGFLRLREMEHDKTFGGTTIIAAYLAFGLGALAVVGDERVAAAAGVAVAGLLAIKTALHGWIRQLTWEELRAALLLLAMTLILLPLLPNEDMGPLDAINPHALWLMTILIAAVSAAGYVAIKWVGADQGIALGGVAGGLVSSTAVTLSFSRLARETPEKDSVLMAGVMLAGLTMMVRILLVAGSLNPGLLRWLLIPLVLAALASGLSALWLLRRGENGKGGVPLALKNPFELTTVLKFGAFLALIMVMGRVLTLWAGEKGAFALAAVSGLADVDAITLTMAQLGGGDISQEAAAGAILVAAGVNTLAKVVIAFVAGGRRPGLRLAAAALLSIVAGAAGFAAGIWWDPLAVFLPHLVAA